MRKKIRQLARGKFEYEVPALTFPDEIELAVTEGQEQPGSFTVKCENHMPLRGVVYSTSPRMECLTPQFDGEDEVKIRYLFHGKGLIEGDVEKGSFTVVCDGSETAVPYEVTVQRLYAEGAWGSVKSLYDFACLAREHWEEAYQLFYHKGFSNIINPKEMKESMLYAGISAARPSRQNMEEFLIGIGKKKPIHFTISEDSCRLPEVTGSLRQSVELTKDEWGYINLSISSDAEFLRPEEGSVTTEDFIGSGCTCRYVIDYDLLHEGWNYGRIEFSSVYEKHFLEVSAHKGPVRGDEGKEKSAAAQIKECQAGILELYQAYRLKRIVTGVWSNETVDILNHLHALDAEEPMYPLMQAQALYINRQKQEAEWILENFRESWTDKSSPVWGYYLYIMTLMEREPSYVDRMTHEIEVIFHEHPDSLLLFWVLLFLREEYDNSARKLEAIQTWVKGGSASPYLYLEAYYIYCQEPYLLARLGRFEVKILRWAVRRHALSKELAAQIFQAVEVSRGFDKVHYELLCAAYELAESPENVGTICSYLIRAQRFEPEYHKWFEMGIELKLRITSLYEAYLLSLDERGVMPVPKIIQMYFQYDASLPYRKMAILYNNIIAEKKKNPQMYEKYAKTMTRFAMEQVALGHMDDNLAVLYEEMLDLGFVNEEIAYCLAGILFTHKLMVFDKKLVRAIVYQRQLREPQIVPIVGQVAYFSLYTDDYVVIFEDEKGLRYVGSVAYQLQALMEPEKFLSKCIALAPEELPYLIAYFSRKKSYLTYAEEDMKYFPRILFARELSPAYQAEMALEIVRFSQGRDDGGLIEKYLSQADFSQMPQSVRRYMMQGLADRRMYGQLYRLIQEFGMDQLSPAARVALVTDALGRADDGPDEADEQLLLLAQNTFFGKKYNDVILSYLCRFYDGPTERMKTLYRAARQFDMDTSELEERILVQAMYAGAPPEGVREIFDSYYNSRGRDLIVLAYITVCAHDYFVKGAQIAQDILDLIEARCRTGQDLNDACKLALLRSFADRGDDAPFTLEEELLSEYTRRNMDFAFFKDLNRSLVKKYHLYDRVFLEYRTDPRSHVVLHYSRDEDGEDFVSEDMPDVYDGIFVRQFVLFFGESMQYYISEERGNKVEVTKSSRLSNADVYIQEDGSRYSLINQMLISQTLQEGEALASGMRRYAQLDAATQRDFEIL